MSAESQARYDLIEPRLLRREGGGWLAISEPGAKLRIGVVADTADEARARFGRELAAWQSLLNETRTEPQ